MVPSIVSLYEIHMKRSQFAYRMNLNCQPSLQFQHEGDIDPSEGVLHAKCIADKIASLINSANVTIFSSPFLRCVHTASIIATKLRTKVHIEDGLYEWLVPSLLVDRSSVRTYPQSLNELQSRFKDAINEEYQSVNPYHIDDSNGNFSFPESEMQLLSRCDDTLNFILEEVRHIDGSDKGEDENIIIVAHAPCVQSLAYAMQDHVENVSDSNLNEWPLGGITRFSRGLDDFRNTKDSIDGHKKLKAGGGRIHEWKMDYYGLTDHMPGEYKNGAGLWSLPCFRKKEDL